MNGNNQALTVQPAGERLRQLLIISASASASSRSEKLGEHVRRLLKGQYDGSEHIRLRQLPAAALIGAAMDDAEIRAAVSAVERAEAIIVVTPTYKGSYSGLLKIFIDLLPQYALRGKVVLPLATGGTIAHVQMLDYSLRPLLQTMWPLHVAQGCFVLDKTMAVTAAGDLTIPDDQASLLGSVVDAFEDVLQRAA